MTKKLEEFGGEQYIYCEECGLSSSINQLGLEAWECLC